VSEFIAEAQVLVTPNTAGFKAELEAQLLAATRGVTVPVTVTPVAARGVTSAVAATQALSATTATAVRNTQQLAGAQSTLATTTKQSTASLLGAGTAAERLNAGLLALRTAVGSTAVIGLGALALAAIAAGKAFTVSLNNFIEFQRQLSVFRVTAGATADEMQRVSAAATALGADVKLPGVSAGDAAVAMTELAKAGLTVQDVATAFVDGLLPAKLGDAFTCR